MATDLLSLPYCGGTTSTFNSGAPLCDLLMGEPKALFLVDSGVEFNASARASISAMVTAIKAATRAARGSRVYPIMSLSNFEDTSKTPTKAAIGNLSIQEITMQQGIPSFTFEHRKGELYHQQLTSAQNSNLKLMIVDNNYVVYGTKTAGGNFTGFSLAEFYVELAKFANATTPSKYPFNITLADITEYKENKAFIQLDSTVLNISGNVDITLALVSQATNVANISATGRGGKNIGTLYATELASVSAWSATNNTTGAAITITSVTYNSTNGYYVITVDSTAYTALTTGTKVNINLVSAAALSALFVDGYESTGYVQITK